MNKMGRNIKILFKMVAKKTIKLFLNDFKYYNITGNFVTSMDGRGHVMVHDYYSPLLPCYGWSYYGCTV